MIFIFFLFRANVKVAPISLIEQQQKTLKRPLISFDNGFGQSSAEDLPPIDYVTIPLNQGSTDRKENDQQRETLLTLHQLSVPTTENPLRRYTHFHSEDAVSVSDNPTTPGKENIKYSLNLQILFVK